MPTNNRIFENMFKERIQNTILETTVMEDGIEHTYFLTYIKDLDRLPDTDQDYVAECLDNVTNETMRIELKDIVTFRESSNYAIDPEKETELVLTTVTPRQEEYKRQQQKHHDSCIDECARCVPISEDVDDVAAKDALLEYLCCKESVSREHFMKWYYKKYFNIDVHEIETKLDELKVIWLKQIEFHKALAAKYLQDEIASAATEEEKSAIQDVSALVLELDESDTINNFHTVEDVITFWPSVLLPAPVFVKGPGVPLYFD
tara:strand:- start:318 stop:1100 length:783 start_codon:yes stop_codon:yes gene_type:complete